MKRTKSIVTTVILSGLLVFGLVTLSESKVQFEQSSQFKVAEDAIFG